MGVSQKANLGPGKGGYSDSLIGLLCFQPVPSPLSDVPLTCAACLPCPPIPAHLVHSAQAAFEWAVCSGSQWKQDILHQNIPEKRLMQLRHVIRGPESLKEKSLLFLTWVAAAENEQNQQQDGKYVEVVGEESQRRESLLLYSMYPRKKLFDFLFSPEKLGCLQILCVCMCGFLLPPGEMPLSKEKLSSIGHLKS